MQDGSIRKSLILCAMTKKIIEGRIFIKLAICLLLAARANKHE